MFLIFTSYFIRLFTSIFNNGLHFHLGTTRGGSGSFRAPNRPTARTKYKRINIVGRFMIGMSGLEIGPV